MRRRKLVSSVALNVVIAVLAMLWLVPVFWLVVSSFRAEQGAYTSYLWPKSFTFGNYVRLFTDRKLFDFPRWFGNTMLVAGCSCAITTILVLMVAYVYSRLRFPSRKFLMNASLVLGMFPGFMSIIAIYHFMKAVSLDQTLLALILVYSGGAALLGCALGFGGVLVATLGNHGGGSVKGMAFMLIASVIFALAGPWNKAVTQHADSFSVSVLNLGVGGLALAVLGFAMGGGLHPQSAAGIPVLLFLAFISGAGYVIWALLMKNNPVSRIAVFGLIIPIMNVLLSALLNGEPLFEWNYLAALVLVCIGIFLVNRAPQTQETKA